MCDILKSIEAVEWLLSMINSFEIYIIYCMALVEIVVYRLRLDTPYLLAFESEFSPAPTAASACSTENSDILASPFDLGKFIVCLPHESPFPAKILCPRLLIR
jgi:hypothetical protein